MQKSQRWMRLVREDIARYRRAIEASGGVFGGSEPIQQLVKQFEGPLDAAHAAAEVGLETDDFLKKIRENSTLQSAGLLVLGVEKGNVKRDAWESEFGTVISVLNVGEHIGLYANMVLIPAGEFQMGSSDSDAYEEEKPVHTVYIDAFYMDKYEVTNAQYKAFIDANPEWRKDRIPGQYHDGGYLKHWNGNNYPIGKGDHPVVYVSWYAAMAYAEWVRKRLPTEAEWEKAARGGLAGAKYPWGNSIDSSDRNFIDLRQKISETNPATTPVGQYPKNGYGLYDMGGNVMEWCIDEFDPGFYAKSPRWNPIAGANSVNEIINDSVNVKSDRVKRGGMWFWVHISFVRVACRFKGTPISISSGFTGFRCVRGVKP